jgi:hypothetical protein
MKFILDDEVIEEISPISESADKAVVITPTVGKREEAVSDIQKEITALDSQIIGPTRAAEINGVPASSASKYGDGKDISNPDVRARVIAAKYDIQDVAVAKLMETLNIIDPDSLTKTKDKVMVLNSLTNVVTKMGDNNKESGPSAVHLHLYAPNQKKETDYITIDA